MSSAASICAPVPTTDSVASAVARAAPVAFNIADAAFLVAVF